MLVLMCFHWIVLYLDDDYCLLYVCCSHMLYLVMWIYVFLIVIASLYFMVIFVRLKLYMCDIVEWWVWYCFLLGVYYVVHYYVFHTCLWYWVCLFLNEYIFFLITSLCCMYKNDILDEFIFIFIVRFSCEKGFLQVHIILFTAEKMFLFFYAMFSFYPMNKLSYDM